MFDLHACPTHSAALSPPFQLSSCRVPSLDRSCLCIRVFLCSDWARTGTRGLFPGHQTRCVNKQLVGPILPSAPNICSSTSTTMQILQCFAILVALVSAYGWDGELIEPTRPIGDAGSGTFFSMAGSAGTVVEKLASNSCPFRHFIPLTLSVVPLDFFWQRQAHPWPPNLFLRRQHPECRHYLGSLH